MSTTSITPTEYSIHPSHVAYELPAHELQDLLPAPPIDRDRLVEQCVESLDFALTLLAEFERTSPSRLDAFDTALAEHNHAAIAFNAHGLKGVAGILAADALMETCLNLESTTSDADWNQTCDLIQQLRHEMQRAIDYIPNLKR